VKKGEKKGSGKPSAKNRVAQTLRRRKLTKAQQKRQAKKEARQRSKLPNSFRLLGQVWQTFSKHWKPLGSIVLVYLILNIIFASGLSNISSSFSTIKASLQASHHFWQALSGFGSLLGTAGTGTSQSGSVLQTVLFVLISLVIIWALRQLLAGQSIKIKQSFYQSMAPLVPFLLIILVIILELLPVTLGTAGLSLVLTTVFGSSTTLTVVLLVFFALFGAWSLYMVSGSIFALYIVTLPNMQPRPALRAAKNLVRFRRWAVIRRLLFLPVSFLLVMGTVIIPLILFVHVLVVPVFYVLSMLALLFIHTYLYSLYRSLLE